MCSLQPHRISVRSITPNRRTSRDAACTMVIGKDTPLGPSNVKASHVTSTSAIISWLPSNSNHQHVVCVNNVEVRTVKPGVYRHTITGIVIFLLQCSIHIICLYVSYIINPSDSMNVFLSGCISHIFLYSSHIMQQL